MTPNPGAPRRRDFAALGGLFLLGACASGGTRAAPVAAPLAIPAAEDSHFLFDGTGWSLVENGRVGEQGPRPVHGEAPFVAAFDLDAALACVAYRDEVALVDLSSLTVDWAPHDLGEVPRGCSVRRGVCALWGDERVVALGSPSGAVLWSDEVGAHLEGGRVIDFALPVGDDRLVLLGSRPTNPGADGEPRLMLLDRSGGTWQRLNSNDVQGVTWVHAAASDGQRIYFAGLHEVMHLRVGGMGELEQKLLVLDADPASLQARVLVREERHAIDTVVRTLAVGSDAVALLLKNGEVRIYGLLEGGFVTAPSYRNTFPGATSIDWLSENRLRVLGPSGAQEIEYR